MSPNGPMHYLGNEGLLTLPKTAFLCSRRYPSEIGEKSRQWAMEQCREGSCVISGFHSPIEKDVLRELLAGTQPVVVALARGLSRALEAEFAAPLAAGRLLIVTRYAPSVTHACEDKCFQRNRMMLELAERVVIGHAAPGGSLERLCREFQLDKPFAFLTGA